MSCSPTKLCSTWCTSEPQTLGQMAMVHGVGVAKLKQYGEAFLAVVTNHLSGDVNTRSSVALRSYPGLVRFATSRSGEVLGIRRTPLDAGSTLTSRSGGLSFTATS